MATIPSKQLHRVENNYASLQMNLSNREIGFNNEDKITYIKIGGVLFPLGIVYKDGDGIEIDSQHRINLTERNSFLPKGATDPIKGALYIVDANNTTGLKVRIGNVDTYIGALLPLPDDGFQNRVLGVVGEHGEVGWIVADVTMDSPDDSVVIEPEVVNNQRVYHITLPNLVEAGTYTKITVNAQGLVTGYATLDASDIPNLDASKINSGTFEPERIRDGSIGTSKYAPKSITADKLDDQSIGTMAMADRSVTEPKFADRAVSARAMGDDSVPSRSLQPESVTHEKLAPGAVSPENMDMSGMIPLLVGENLSWSLFNGFLKLSAARRSFSNAGYIEGSISAPTWYIVATYGGKQVRIDFRYVSWGCTVSLDATHSENVWLVNASDVYMLSKCTCCTSESYTGTNSDGPSNSVQTLLGSTNTIGSSTNWVHELTLFDSATTRPYVAVDFHVMLMFKQNNVSYVAEFNAALHYHNDTVHHGEAFSGIATLRIVEST